MRAGRPFRTVGSAALVAATSIVVGGAALLASTPARAQDAPAPAERWAFFVVAEEDVFYGIDFTDGASRPKAMQARLNTIGAQGWSLAGPPSSDRMCIVVPRASAASPMLVFQRRLAPGEKSASDPELPWLRDRPTSDARAAISSLRTLVTVQQLFRDSDRDANGIADFAPSLEALGSPEYGGMLAPDLASGHQAGYVFLMEVSEDGASWCAMAIPTDPRARSFYADESGVIRYEQGDTKPTARSRPLGE